VSGAELEAGKELKEERDAQGNPRGNLRNSWRPDDFSVNLIPVVKNKKELRKGEG